MTNSVSDVLHSVSVVMQRSADMISTETSLIDQGMDSIAIMTLATEWSSNGVPISYMEMLADPTVNAWQRMLAEG